jgi:hypothetical protein
MTDKSDDTPQWGPAMAALPNDRWRLLVTAIYSEDAPRKGKGLWPWAMERAGFNFKNAQVAGVNAHRMLQDPRFRKACAEYSKSVLRGLSAETIRSVRDLLANPRSRHHAKAIDAVLARSDPVEQIQHVKVEQTWQPPSIEATAAVMKRIAELARQAGMPQLPPLIDAVFVEIKPESE